MSTGFKVVTSLCLLSLIVVGYGLRTGDQALAETGTFLAFVWFIFMLLIMLWKKPTK